MQKLLEFLACPHCKASPLNYENSSRGENLSCPSCSRIYPVTDGIPDLIPEMIAKDLSTKDEEWSRWTDKLGNFVQWRRETWNGSSKADKLSSQALMLKERFVEFTGLRDSGKKIIDIGCGDGGMSNFLGDCSYFGIDPLLVYGSTYDFAMVRGVGEHLPFINSAFDEVILNQVLDHCNRPEKLLDEALRVIGSEGSLNVMQCINEPKGLMLKLYMRLLAVYLRIKGDSTLDTKARRFDHKGLTTLFQDRFEHVQILEYSSSQMFIRATRRKTR